jgi:hypothetical protein
MHFQFAANGQWYSATAFTPRGGRGSMLSRGGPGGQGRNNGPEDAQTPVLIQPQRIQQTQALYKGMLASDLAREEASLIRAALAEGRGVYAVLTPTATEEFQRRMSAGGFATTIQGEWTEPDAVQDAARPNEPRAPTTRRTPADNDAAGPFSRFRRRGGRDGRPPGGPGGFGRNDASLAMPAMRIPRLFDTAATFRVLQIGIAEPTTLPVR